MSVPPGFYAPWESEIDSFSKIDELLTKLSERWLVQRRQFAWRGVADAEHSLHSSLYRRLLWKWQAERTNEPPDETALDDAEGEILAEAHRWGLHNGPQGRLSVLNQLAA